MTDIVSREKRSQMMAGIKSKNTKPELLVRSLIHKRGFRFRLHDSLLPGKPDLVFPKYRAVIFVNGCFFHGHDCDLFRVPETNGVFWKDKILKNKDRDQKKIDHLNRLGWRVLVIWECSSRGKGKLDSKILTDTCAKWLANGKNNLHIRGL